MECLLQYLDEIDDLAGVVGLALESIRRAIRAAIVLSLAVGVQSLGIMLALTRPPLALAAVSLLCAVALYRAVVNGGPGGAAPAA